MTSVVVILIFMCAMNWSKELRSQGGMKDIQLYGKLLQCTLQHCVSMCVYLTNILCKIMFVCTYINNNNKVRYVYMLL